MSVDQAVATLRMAAANGTPRRALADRVVKALGFAEFRVVSPTGLSRSAEARLSLTRAETKEMSEMQTAYLRGELEPAKEAKLLKFINRSIESRTKGAAA